MPTQLTEKHQVSLDQSHAPPKFKGSNREAYSRAHLLQVLLCVRWEYHYYSTEIKGCHYSLFLPPLQSEILLLDSSTGIYSMMVIFLSLTIVIARAKCQIYTPKGKFSA